MITIKVVIVLIVVRLILMIAFLLTMIVFLIFMLILILMIAILVKVVVEFARLPMTCGLLQVMEAEHPFVKVEGSIILLIHLTILMSMVLILVILIRIHIPTILANVLRRTDQTMPRCRCC